MTSTDLIINYIDSLIQFTDKGDNDSVTKAALMTLNNVRDYAVQCKLNDQLNNLIITNNLNNAKENQ